MADSHITISVRDLEQVKLLLFQLNALAIELDEAPRSQREVRDQLRRIIARFQEVRLADDRVE